MWVLKIESDDNYVIASDLDNTVIIWNLKDKCDGEDLPGHTQMFRVPVM